MQVRTIDITPDKSLIEKLGSVGFAPEEAVAEFVDNALDAKFDERTGDELVQGTIHVSVTLSADAITIQDDSAGITDFDNCLRAAWSDKRLEIFLGSYGLGLKTAAMSLGRKLTVISTRIGEGLRHSTTLDMERWYADPSWTLQVEDEPAAKGDHGTRIVVEKLHVAPDLMRDDLMRGLAERFAPFIQDKTLEVRLGNLALIPEDVAFLREDDPHLIEALRDLGVKDFKRRHEFNVKVGDLEVTGWVDLLEKRSLGGRFGFHVYRGRRLIQPFMKIGVLDHPSNANVFGHVYLPRDFPVSFTKNKIEVQRPVFAELKKKLDHETAEHRRIAQRLAHERTPLVTKKVELDVRKSLNALARAVQNSKLMQALFEEERKRSLEEKSNDKGPVDSEIRKPRARTSVSRPIPKNVRARNPIPGKPTQKKDWWYITVSGFKLKLRHEWTMTEERQMYYSKFDDVASPPELLVLTNVGFDAYPQTTDKVFYATSTVIMALSQTVFSLADPRKLQGKSLIEVQEDLWANWARAISAGVAAES